jgi:hypothetical protein
MIRMPYFPGVGFSRYGRHGYTWPGFGKNCKDSLFFAATGFIPAAMTHIKALALMWPIDLLLGKSVDARRFRFPRAGDVAGWVTIVLADMVYKPLPIKNGQAQIRIANIARS